MKKKDVIHLFLRTLSHKEFKAFLLSAVIMEAGLQLPKHKNIWLVGVLIRNLQSGNSKATWPYLGISSNSKRAVCQTYSFENSPCIKGKLENSHQFYNFDILYLRAGYKSPFLSFFLKENELNPSPLLRRL